MINNQNNLFTWNDLVVIVPNAPTPYSPGQIAVICGMEKIGSSKLSQEFNVEIGTWIYTIEFGNGSSIEIPEIYLKKEK